MRFHANSCHIRYPRRGGLGVDEVWGRLRRPGPSTHLQSILLEIVLDRVIANIETFLL